MSQKQADCYIESQNSQNDPEPNRHFYLPMVKAIKGLSKTYYKLPF